MDDKTPVIKESLTFSDDRQKLDMSVTKLDSEDNTPIAGAVFGPVSYTHLHLLVRKATKTGEIIVDLVTTTQTEGFNEEELLAGFRYCLLYTSRWV